MVCIAPDGPRSGVLWKISVRSRMLQMNPGLYYGPSGLHGRGVFCLHDLTEGDLIEICPVIVLPEGETEWLKHSHLYGYYFTWEEETCAIALGFGSLYNHADNPNADFTPDYGDGTLLIEALRAIPSGEEITIDYQAGARVRELWF